MIKTDNEVWALLVAIFNAGLAARGLPAAVLQSYQPTQQGVDSGPVVVLHSIDSKRYGWPEDTSFYDEGANELKTLQGYWLERTYQVNALAIQDPANVSAPTAFDYIDAAAAIIQTTETQETLRGNGIGVLRVQPLRVAYIVDDKGRHEQVPAFDFTLTYRQTFTQTAEPIQTVEAEIFEV
jgi:hypothetical protein